MIVAPPLNPSPARQPTGMHQELWRTLHTFCLYRLTIALILAASYWGFQRYQLFGGNIPWLSSFTLAAYLLLSAALLWGVRLRLASPAIQTTIQIFIDVTAITLLMHTSGGVRSGISLLLLVTLAAAGLVSRGLMAFFHAALAALAILFEQTWQLLYGNAPANDFLQAGLLSGSYFAIAGLGYTMAKYARGAEKIAEERSIDLANMAQINELVIRDMPDGFIIVDERGVIRQHNAQSEILLGGFLSARTHMLSDCLPQLAAYLDIWREDRSHVFPVMRSFRTQKDYHIRFLAIGDKEPAPIVIFIEDASRIHEEAQQMKLVALGRLTASIAHEIRNPLSSINHAAELLQEDPARNETDARLLAIIQDNAHRLDCMVSEVLHLNRRDRAHPESIDPVIYLQQFVHEFCGNEKIPPEQIDLQIATTSRITFDRGHLDQILWNLVRNACRHGSGRPGSVVLLLKPAMQEHTLFLDVHDDGPGIASETLAHLFEPFFTTDSKGTGLGLYIARELAEANNARLEYLGKNESAARQGAHFRLILKGET